MPFIHYRALFPSSRVNISMYLKCNAMKNKLKSEIEIWQYERRQRALIGIQEEVGNYLVNFCRTMWQSLFTACYGGFSASPCAFPQYQTVKWVKFLWPFSLALDRRLTTKAECHTFCYQNKMSALYVANHRWVLTFINQNTYHIIPALYHVCRSLQCHLVNVVKRSVRFGQHKYIVRLKNG